MKAEMVSFEGRMAPRSGCKEKKARRSLRSTVRQVLCWLWIACVALLGASHAEALTMPIAGAVAFPQNVTLFLPFPAGSSIYVLSGYSPTGGSSLHADTNACCKANDYYALDLNYNEPGGGKGKPIVAPLAGTVVKAGWATQGWANYGQRVILAHDLGDGHIYHSLYAHMNAIDPAVTEGSMVTVGQVLGELGQSCQGQLSCGSFSTPHLHWAIHRDSLIGGSGTGGSYGGNAVVPEPLDGAENLQQGMVITSSNTGQVVCGDGYCTGGETNASCPADCPVCQNIPSNGRIVDDKDLCFEQGGNPQYWYTQASGYDGSLLWTHATESATTDNYGIWNFTFDEAGDYQVEIFAEPGFAQSKQANYSVVHSGGSDDIVVDQSVGGWLDLGTFPFDVGGSQRVRLNDNTGEPLASNLQLVFDAVRLTRIGGNPGTGGSSSGMGGSTSSAGMGGATSSGVAGSSGAGWGEGGDSGATPDPGGTGSCGCRTVSSVPVGPAALLLPALAAMGIARRRSRRRSA
jgi:hypothetical protein